MSNLQHQDNLVLDPDDGYFSEVNIKSHPNVFFKYMTSIFKSIEKVTLRAPFQLMSQFTMKRRSITLGKEQVAELMMRFAKIPGLVESLVDNNVIPNREDVFVTTNERRDQKLQLQAGALDRKRRRITTLGDERASVDLPDRKRMRIQNSLSIVREQMQASEARAATTVSKARAPKTTKTKTVTMDQWLHCHQTIASCLFYPPRDARKH